MMSDNTGKRNALNPRLTYKQFERLDAWSFLIDEPRTKLATTIINEALQDPPASEAIRLKDEGPVSVTRCYFLLDDERAETLGQLAIENDIGPNTLVRRLIRLSLETVTIELPQIDIVADLRRGLQVKRLDRLPGA